MGQPLPSPEDPHGLDVGARLRELRLQRGVTLRELAERLDVTVSALSQIERGRLRPSVTRLYQIVTALGTTLDAVFGSRGAEGVVPAEIGPPSGAAAGSPLRRPVHQDPDSRPVIELHQGITWTRVSPLPFDGAEMLEVSYPPGSVSTIGGEFLRHVGHEVGYVTAGRLVVEVAFDRFELATGASLLIDSSVPHRVSNTTDETATAIWFTLRDALPRSADPRR